MTFEEAHRAYYHNNKSFDGLDPAAIDALEHGDEGFKHWIEGWRVRAAAESRMAKATADARAVADPEAEPRSKRSNWTGLEWDVFVQKRNEAIDRYCKADNQQEASDAYGQLIGVLTDASDSDEEYFVTIFQTLFFSIRRTRLALATLVETTVPGMLADLAALKAQVAALETRVATLDDRTAEIRPSELVIEQSRDDPRTLNFVVRRGAKETFYPVTFPVPIYRGVWQAGVMYEVGDSATYNGSQWHCRKATAVRPGESGESAACWQLQVKRGSDGRSVAR